MKKHLIESILAFIIGTLIVFIALYFTQNILCNTVKLFIAIPVMFIVYVFYLIGFIQMGRYLFNI